MIIIYICTELSPNTIIYFIYRTMSLKAKFHWIKPQQAMKAPSLSLLIECDNWLQSEFFTLQLYCGQGDTIWHYQNLKLDAGESLDVNGDTLGWVWGKGDTATIMDKKGKVIGEWEVKWTNLQHCTYCKDTHKCPHCGGMGTTPSGFKPSTLTNSQFTAFKPSRAFLKACDYCFGTGQCMNCYLPPAIRKGQPIGRLRPTYYGPRSLMGRDPNRPLIPYSEPNIDFQLQRMKEWDARVTNRRVDLDIAVASGFSDSVVRDRQGLVNRAEDILRNIY